MDFLKLAVCGTGVVAVVRDIACNSHLNQRDYIEN